MNKPVILLSIFSYIFSFNALSASIDQDLSALDQQLMSLMNKNGARSYQQIKQAISGLEVIYIKDQSPDRTRLAHIILFIEKQNNIAAIRLGLDWLYYNEKMSTAPQINGVDYMSSSLGLLLLANPDITTQLYADDAQFNKEQISSLIAYAVYEYNNLPSPPPLSIDLLREYIDLWPLRDNNRRVLERFLEDFI